MKRGFTAFNFSWGCTQTTRYTSRSAKVKSGMRPGNLDCNRNPLGIWSWTSRHQWVGFSLGNYPLVSSNWLENPRTEWRFLARKIHGFLWSMASSTPCLMTPEGRPITGTMPGQDIWTKAFQPLGWVETMDALIWPMIPMPQNMCFMLILSWFESWDGMHIYIYIHTYIYIYIHTQYRHIIYIYICT